LIFFAIKGFKKKALWSFCILYFFITISIVSSIIILSSNAYADRFLYTPSLDVCIVIGVLLYRLPDFKIFNPNKNFFSFSGKNLQPIVFLAIILGLSLYKTSTYLPAWKNDQALFNYNLKVNPKNARMLKNLGSEYVIQAVGSQDTIQQKQLANRGIPLLEKGLSIYPRQSTGWTQLGNAYFILGDYTKAEENLKKALAIDSTDRFGMSSFGSILYMTGRYQMAANTWEKIDPSLRNPSDNYNLYLVYRVLGINDKAEYYKKLSGR
jgi:tetratricopeptide (TPR) repeat protein